MKFFDFYSFNGEIKFGLWATDKGLCRLQFSPSDEMAINAHPIIEKAKAQLDLYFNKKLKYFDLPLDINRGSAFQKEVWSSLAKIPYGQKLSYAQLAQKMNKSKSYCRAIGGACNKNLLPIIIPCHRVVGKDNSLTGYAGGLSMKSELLELEKDFIN